MKFVYSILFVALLGFLVWPYYRIYQIDDALGVEDLQALAPLVDLAAIRNGTVNQLEAKMVATTGQAEEGSILDWVQDNLREFGVGAVDQMIDLEWVRETLQRSARQAITEPPYYFMRGIDYAFFDGFDSFLIRLGPIEQNPTHVRMRLQEGNWRITGIYD
jgi:hypothetical protein